MSAAQCTRCEDEVSPESGGKQCQRCKKNWFCLICLEGEKGMRFGCNCTPLCPIDTDEQALASCKTIGPICEECDTLFDRKEAGEEGYPDLHKCIACEELVSESTGWPCEKCNVTWGCTRCIDHGIRIHFECGCKTPCTSEQWEDGECDVIVCVCENCGEWEGKGVSPESDEIEDGAWYQVEFVKLANGSRYPMYKRVREPSETDSRKKRR